MRSIGNTRAGMPKRSSTMSGSKHAAHYRNKLARNRAAAKAARIARRINRARA